ncbi:MAG TPA: nickel-dependent lactate racemase [Bryobacteraceae bacterium]|jgi:nickel-dependent lactate racemase|nr:nickel-dependent lactate racemase [Bryobacteraceae bacterium]
MRVDLAFGKTGLGVDLPEGFQYHILEARSARPLADPARSLEGALDAPVGTPPLAELARGKRTAAISVCDITRPAPNRQTLPPILRRLEQAGLRKEDISILIATGLHRASTDAEIRQICGEKTAADYRVVNHDARNLSQHRHLGSTRSGTPVYIDDRFIGADLHITLGFIEPHLMLGFSGGRKLVAPGLAAQETIKVLHSPKFMRDRRAVEGSTEDNPLHRELLEIARMARHDFALDVALARDRSIAGVFAGNPEQAHRCGVEFVSKAMLETLAAPVAAVITSAAGYPLDMTFYQTIKGVTAAAHIVKPGGRILVVGSCDEGAGAPEFCEMLLNGGGDREFLERIASSPVIVDQWQLEKLALVTTERELFYYVPGLPAEYHPKLWGRSFSMIDAAVAALTAGLPAGASIAVVPEGPYVLATCSSVAEEQFTRSI